MENMRRIFSYVGLLRARNLFYTFRQGWRSGRICGFAYLQKKRTFMKLWIKVVSMRTLGEWRSFRPNWQKCKLTNLARVLKSGQYIDRRQRFRHGVRVGGNGAAVLYGVRHEAQNPVRVGRNDNGGGESTFT